MKKLCVIPAKRRSTRFPDKNVALLDGKPLVVRSIETAKASRMFERIMVSTDDADIAQLGLQYGAEVPYLRDESLTRDDVEVPAVVRHAILWYRAQLSEEFDWVCILQPTSPLRTPFDVMESWKLCESHPDAVSVVSVSAYHHSPYWALRVEASNLVPEFPSKSTASRQHLPALYHPDGVVVWRAVDSILTGGNVYDNAVPYFTPPESAVDIDHAEDLSYATWRKQSLRDN